MWISQKAMDEISVLATQVSNWQSDYAAECGKRQRLELENAQLRNDIEWFKHRLNQVEMERAMLIQSALGVKVSVPRFVPVEQGNEDEALSRMPDLSTVGNDAHLDNEEDPTRVLGSEQAADYTLLPGYRMKG
jgi:hypothetical protein